MSGDLVVGFAFGVVIATVTAPVGVSGAVFLLPVQLSVLGVPSPAVTPTNLLYNIVAVPGALARYRRDAALWTDLSRRLLTGTIPGVVVGALIRVLLLPNGTVFKVLVAGFLLPLGVWLLTRDRRPSIRSTPFSPAVVTLLGVGAATYTALALTGHESAGPRWLLGVLALALSLAYLLEVARASMEPADRTAPTRRSRNAS
ncbi:MAG: sulfite exporter TauE/SafE family protein [Actinomycetes bacterium]